MMREMLDIVLLVAPELRPYISMIEQRLGGRERLVKARLLLHRSRIIAFLQELK